METNSGVVLHEHYRKRHQNVRDTTNNGSARSERVRIRDDHENNEIIADVPDPAFERDGRKVGPRDAKKGECEEKRKRIIARDESAPLYLPLGQDLYGASHEDEV